MRKSHLLFLLGVVLPGVGAPAVTMDWVAIGDPGNACDAQPQGCFGAVAYSYRISKYEVTNAQYAEFLNAKAATDRYALYKTTMNDSVYGGITRSGVDGSYTYAAKPGYENNPVNMVTLYDGLRFLNWLHNGEGSGDTETGAYTLLGDTITPSNGDTVTHNPGANVFLPTENEWYKAAYYDALSASFFDFPSAANAATTCSGPTASPNSANCGNVVGNVTPVGAYTGSASPYGTFDQGGNVFEWLENTGSFGGTIERGGYFFGEAGYLAASFRNSTSRASVNTGTGFRIASPIPEPGTGLLLLGGLLGLAAGRVRSA